MRINRIISIRALMNASHLPAIASIPLTANRTAHRFGDERPTHSSRPRRHPRPGDVYRRPRTSSCPVNQPRPLGLLPNRSSETWKDMVRMLATPTTGGSRPSAWGEDEGAGVRDAKATNIPQGVSYRCPALASTKPVDGSPNKDDRAYRELLLRCKIAEYGLLKETGERGGAISPQRPNTRRARKRSGSVYPRDAEASTSQYVHLEYINFVGQAQLWNKLLTSDRRFALEWQPCSRCLERGTKCSHRIVLRTGGGYIVLDCSDLSEDDKQKLFEHITATSDNNEGGHIDGGGVSAGDSSTNTNAGLGNSNDIEGGNKNGGGGGGGDGGGGGQGNGGGVLKKRGKSEANQGGTGEQTNRDQDDQADGSGFVTASSGHIKTEKDHTEGVQGVRRGGEEGGWDVGGSQTEADRAVNAGASSTSVKSGGSGGDGDLGPSTSKVHVRFSNRPQSSAQRRLLGKGADSARRATNLERRTKGGKVKGDEDDLIGAGHPPRAREDGGGGGGGGGGGDVQEDKHRRDLEKFKYHNDTSDDNQPKPPYHQNLKPHHSKRNDLKALQCTLQELQGIDPLDYLAKYCIIDQEKLPHYRRVYDNVDRDEDDEIGVSELDFALKAVNYELITDAEMRYVHSVLELAGRYKLNFRLFSLVAALSEKVVALEDMVKRLVNQMDCEALETKMKKCKELFYLLADSETSHQGGVVTSSSLAVELQAGGLTSDHVGYVVDRLNHQGKGIVEFLDYLTYVPLFVEIHDSIYGNPLDFSRMK